VSLKTVLCLAVLALLGGVQAPIRALSAAANLAPIPKTNGPYTGVIGLPVQFTSKGSSDPDGDALEWIWIESVGAEARLLATGPAPEVALSTGTHALTLLVVDPTGLAARHDFRVTVADTEPPAILRLDASPAVLWPPDHRLVPVTVVLEAKDACSGIARTRLMEVTSSETDDRAGNGRTAGDIVVRGSENGADLLLRAERKGGGPGRVYRVRFVVADDAGHSRDAAIEITVPASGPGNTSAPR